MSYFVIGHEQPAFIYDSPMITREVSWAHSLMNIQAAWAQSTGKGVRVGIIDSGCDYHHKDLSGKVFGGMNCTKNGSGYIDVLGHGTATASAISAKKTGHGVAGVAPDSTLFIAKAIDDVGMGQPEFIKCAVESCIAAGCGVVNMSLGSPEPHPEIEEVIKRGVDMGIIFVAAAGNSGDISVKDNDGFPLEDWPARLPFVVSVAAIDRNEEVPDWSSPGHIEFSAPGVDILTCYPGNRYAAFSGTSMAAPFISGTCALLKEHDPNIGVTEAVELLSRYSLRIGDSRECGAGLINVGAAINAFVKFGDSAKRG